MSDIISPLLQWLNAHPNLAGLVTFIISAAESVAIIGTIVPGSIMMTALGTLAGAGVIPLWPTIFWAIIGAIVGDGISYWFGYYFKDQLPQVWPFYRYPSLLTQGEEFIKKYGRMSVFIGRFVGPVRALVPLVAGMLGMKPLQFTIANITSAIGWAPAYMLPGILLGAASLELPPDIAIHVILVLMLLLLFILLCLWFIYKIFQSIQQQITQVQTRIWQGLHHSKYFSSLTRFLQHHDVKKTRGQLNLAIYFLLTSLVFVLLALYVKLAGPQNIMINDAMFHLFRGIRSIRIDHIMILITSLGEEQVILPIVMGLVAWFLIKKRWRLTFHVLALLFLAAGGVFVTKHLIQSPRPFGIVDENLGFSMPSGHTTLATVVFMGIAFLIVAATKRQKHLRVYFPALFITFAVGISRLYLGVHWFTDILAGWLLGASVLMLIIISYQRQKEAPVNPVGIMVVSLLMLCVSFTFYLQQHQTSLLLQYAQVDWPKTNIEMDRLWQRADSLPAYRVSLIGFPSQPINIAWVGSLDQIKTTLQQEGWTDPPERDWISVLHRLADISSTEYLPIVSPQYLDKKPALILTRQINGKKTLLILRLWDANRFIKETNAVVWVGNVGIAPRSYSWIFKKHRKEIQVEPGLIFPNQTTGHWEEKVLDFNMPHARAQKIMLIR